MELFANDQKKLPQKVVFTPNASFFGYPGAFV